jgi:hypothetical protein
MSAANPGGISLGLKRLKERTAFQPWGGKTHTVNELTMIDANMTKNPIFEPETEANQSLREDVTRQSKRWSETGMNVRFA